MPSRSSRARRRSPAVLAAALVAAALVGLVVAVPAATGSAAPPAARPAAVPVTSVVELIPLQTSSDRRIVDLQGRDVLLRGANVNSLGEYWQGDPTVDPTIPVTDADWAEFASRGLDVVRLIVTWSRIEPAPGVIDQSYLDLVDTTVKAAAAHGVYTVIDMHQDAYTAFISTPPADAGSCPSGTGPGKGWDGAPSWAVRTDGLSTCTPGERNASPAVNRAWNNFWNDVDGVRGRFEAMWGAVATRFAARPEVAGYDILNEPEVSMPAADMQPLYQDFIGKVYTSIRTAESAAGAPFEHIVFVEPAIPAGDPSRGLVIPNPAAASGVVTNVAAAAHNYAESIGLPGISVTIEQMTDFIIQLTANLGVPQWTGEYGFWSTDAATLDKVRRYAASEDRTLGGGAWWQWRQSCGDPHAISWNGSAFVAPGGTSTQLHLLGCPTNVDQGPNDDFLRVLGRGYPRAAPGRLSLLTSDPDTGALRIEATAGAGDTGHQLVVWTPTPADADHQVFTRGLTGVQSYDVEGGRIVVATVPAPGAYALAIGATDPLPAVTTTTTAAPGSTTSTATGPAAVPVATVATPRFTG